MQSEQADTRLRVAVVGGGVAGIMAAYRLQKKYSVSLFEKNGYVGGHTHTIPIPDGPDAGTPVDTGFIVLNDRTYPILNRFFQKLGVPIEKSDMSFSYCCEKTGVQYGSRNLSALFAQRMNLVNPVFWGMLTEILIFNRLVLNGLQRGTLDGITLGRFLRRFHFSHRFRQWYLFPMVAAIWSAPDAEVDRFPMLSFARFFYNHGLLAVRGAPQWYFVSGGSHSYVKAFTKDFEGSVHTNAGVSLVRREKEGVVLTEENGREHRFDRVVIAAHADEALRMLANPTKDQQRLLGPWRYSVNRTFLHTDTRWMPSNTRAWASWNFFREAGAGEDAPVTLTYHMNRLQRLNTRCQYLVTLNPFRHIAEESIVAEMTYTHPTFTFDSMETQRELSLLNDEGSVFFCGSYFGYGFHEDAARSGFQAAEALGVADEF